MAKVRPIFSRLGLGGNSGFLELIVLTIGEAFGMIQVMPESYKNPRKAGYKVNPLANSVKPETKLEKENRIAGNYFTAFASVGTAFLGLATDIAIRAPDILLTTNNTMTAFLGQIGQFIASHPIEAPLFIAVGAVIPPLFRLIRG